jgi:hypothetical protein
MLANALTSLIRSLLELVLRLILLPWRIIMWLRHDPIAQIRRWWRANPTEGWGYVWWGCVGAAIAVPELWAAFGGEDLAWPTISGTTGHLEVLHQWIAFIVIALIVWAALHVIRVTTRALEAGLARLTSPDNRATPSAPHGAAASAPPLTTKQFFAAERGRRTIYEGSPRPMQHPLLYFLFAVGAVALPSLIFAAAYHVDAEDHRYVVGYVMYASIAFWWVILPSWAVYKEGWLVPFPSLFQTFIDLERRAPITTTVFGAGLLILMTHLVLYPWPSTIPDTNRLHTTYTCHPLQPPAKPLSKKQQEACTKLDSASISPPAGSP